jgi:hypothetical protein
MKIPRWAQVLIGVGIVMVFLGIGAIIAVTAYFSDKVAITESSSREADDEFEKVRQRFKSKPPLVEIKDGERIANRAPVDVTASRQALQTLHVLAWDSHEEKLANVKVPWWVVRLKTGPIRFSTYATGLDDEGINLRPEEIERYGAGIVLEMTGRRGDRVMLWTE